MKEINKEFNESYYPNLYENEIDEYVVEAFNFNNFSNDTNQDIVLVDTDDEFHNLFGKTWNKIKDKLKIGKEYKEERIENRAERKEEREEKKQKRIERREVRKKKLRDFLTKAKAQAGKILGGAKKVLQFTARLAVIGSFALSRQAFLGLLRLNYRGMATKMKVAYDLNKQGYQKELWQKIVKKYYKMGGQEKNLIQATHGGWQKRPLLCGKKCKAKILDSTSVGDFSQFDGIVMLETMGADYWNVEPATATAVGVGASVAQSAPVLSPTAVLLKQLGGVMGALGTMIGGIASVQAERNNKREIEAGDAQNQREMDLMTDRQQMEMDIAWTQLQNDLSPQTQIIQSDALTPEEKTEALSQINDIEMEDTTTNIKKILMWTGVAFAGIVGILMINKYFNK